MFRPRSPQDPTGDLKHLTKAAKQAEARLSARALEHEKAQYSLRRATEALGRIEPAASERTREILCKNVRARRVALNEALLRYNVQLARCHTLAAQWDNERQRVEGAYQDMRKPVPRDIADMLSELGLD